MAENAGLDPYKKALERMTIEPFGDVIDESEKKKLSGTQKWADARMKILEKLQHDEYELARKGNVEKLKLDDLLDKQRGERLNLEAENDRKVWEYKLDNAKTFTSQLDTVFLNLNEARGGHDKTLFLLHKAAAIATIIIDTSKGVMTAMGEHNWPMAALITAMGASQIAIVSAQTLARGGLVQGYSPSKTADNIPLKGTAGEFMQPVDSVEYYGTQIYEAMRQKLIPRELFSGLALQLIPKELFSGLVLPSAPGPSGENLQAGGLVGVPGPSGENLQAGRLAGTTGKSEFTFINITDPRELDRYLATPAGKDAILNVISSRAQSVRRVIRG